MNMKRQTLILMAVLLTSTAAIALTFLPGTTALTYYDATIVISPEEAGAVSPMTAHKLSSTSVTFTATPNAGYSFEGWYNGDKLLSSANPYSHKMTANITITAKFKAEAAHSVLGFIKAGCESMGTVNVNPEGSAVESGYKYNHGCLCCL